MNTHPRSISIHRPGRALASSLLPAVAGLVASGLASLHADEDNLVVETDRVVAPDAAPIDWLGHAIARDGNLLVLGAPLEEDPSTSEHDATGSVYVYRFDGVDWVLELKISNPHPDIEDGLEGADQFGFHLDAIDGPTEDLLVVGVPDDGADEGEEDHGAVYVYRNVGGAWLSPQVLLASDGQADDHLGQRVRTDGEVILAGAEDAAYVFRRSGSFFFEEAKLVMPLPPQAQFGTDVAIQGDVAAVSAPSTVTRGTVFLFRFDGKEWVHEHTLDPTQDDGDLDARFGFRIAMDGDVLVSGDPRETITGSVYFYRFQSSQWVLEGTRCRSKGFALSLDVSGDTAIVGAPIDGELGLQAGAAHVYQYDGSGWRQTRKLLASDGQSGDQLGFEVSMDELGAAVGAVGSQDDRGAGYTYAALPPLIVADIDLDGVVGINDLLILLADWGFCTCDMPCLSDLDGDLAVDINDLLILLAAWDS